MLHRTLSVGCVALALAILTGGMVRSDDKDDVKTKSHTGTVISAKEGKLTMESKGKEHSHDVPATAKIICDGKECKLVDLKAGVQVRVTESADTGTVLRVEADTKKKAKDSDR